jgi:hypothetical protein
MLLLVLNHVLGHLWGAADAWHAAAVRAGTVRGQLAAPVLPLRGLKGWAAGIAVA